MANERYGRGDDRQRSYYGRDERSDYGQDYGSGGYGSQGYGSSQRYGGNDRQTSAGARDYRESGMTGDYGGNRDYGSGSYGSSGSDWRGSGQSDRWSGGGDYYRGDSDRSSGQRYGSGQAQGYDRGYGDSDRGRGAYGQGRGGYGQQSQGRDDDRGFMARAGDEVRSWFGDEDAERRREMDARRDEQASRGGYGRDEHYHSWRNQQIASFDRDYDEYRRENQSKFHNEFSSWRTDRQGQRDLLGQVQEHASVVGSDGEHIGTVDKVRGDRIVLTKSDADAGGRHHSVPSNWLQSADGSTITLRKTAAEAKAHWRDEERQDGDRGAMFGDNRYGSSDDRLTQGGSTNHLNRSFSGTY